MTAFTVGAIEALLFEEYPAAYAVADDRFGLLVGDRRSEVSGIAFALDATVPMIEAAAAAGCNLLVTHHPPFWVAPRSFLAAASAGSVDGAAVFAAASQGVALLAMHTNVDCSGQAAELLLGAFGYRQEGVLKPHLRLADGRQIGLGQLARPSSAPAPTLRQLAERCQQAFGAPAKVWGDPQRRIELLSVCSGAGGELIPEVIAAHADCYITGELRHHECLYLADEGIALIELGHDRSELPYRQLLAESLRARGVADRLPFVILEPTADWLTPDSLVREDRQAAREVGG